MEGCTRADEVQPSLAELEHLRASVTPVESEEPLECLLIAASSGGGAVIEVLELALLCHAGEALLKELESTDPESCISQLAKRSGTCRSRKISIAGVILMHSQKCMVGGGKW
jgi:hypothetical protein